MLRQPLRQRKQRFQVLLKWVACSLMRVRQPISKKLWMQLHLSLRMVMIPPSLLFSTIPIRQTSLPLWLNLLNLTVRMNQMKILLPPLQSWTLSLQWFKRLMKQRKPRLLPKRRRRLLQQLRQRRKLRNRLPPRLSWPLRKEKLRLELSNRHSLISRLPPALMKLRYW